MTPNYSIVLLITIASTGLALSMTTLWLIHSMRRWNGYLQLIWHLTLSQSLYDISIVMVAKNSPFAWLRFRSALRFFSGLSATFWTNAISFIVVYVIVTMKNFDIVGNFPVIFCLITIPSLILSIVNAVEWYDVTFDLYYWIRIVSIAVNAILYLVLVAVIRQRDNLAGKVTARKADPVKTLAHRMKYYPIAQIFTRLGAAWYEAVYSGGNEQNYERDESPSEQGALLLYAVTLPSAGILFFIIFISVSPGAKEYLLGTLSRVSAAVCGLPLVSLDPDDEVIVTTSPIRDTAGREVDNETITTTIHSSVGNEIIRVTSFNVAGSSRNDGRGSGFGARSEGIPGGSMPTPMGSYLTEESFELYDEDQLTKAILNSRNTENRQSSII